MKVLAGGAAQGRPVARFESVGFGLTRLVRPAGDVRIGLAQLAAGGSIGWHPATTAQLLVVVAGEGQVRGADGGFRPICLGQAALWSAGEWHETKSAPGLTAIIVEAETLELAPDVVAIE